MKKIHLIALIALKITLNMTAFSQTPDILRIKNDSAQIVLEHLDIHVEVIGNIATTTTKMIFYNPQNRVLEGELNFPLGEGQSVYRYAIDVNGKLREGVAVEKKLGRQAFENVIRQQIDPGLLEMTAGNNYKSRIYPIPANGRKTVVVAYEEELNQEKNPVYQLVLGYGKVKEFNLHVEVINQPTMPAIKENLLDGFGFQQTNGTFVAGHQASNFQATGTFSFEIPTTIEEQVFRQKTDNVDFFYINLMPEVKTIPKTLPKSIGIVWDTSKSGESRDIDKELALLQSYLKKLQNVETTVLKFSNELIEEQNFSINNGNATDLIESLTNTIYDGGTNLTAVNLAELPYDEILLFSDGLSNIYDFNWDADLKPTHTITSSKSNDIPQLSYLSQSTKGNFINLSTTTIEEATETLTNNSYQFLHASYSGGDISQVYPSKPQTIKEGQPFSVSGQINTQAPVKLTLHFGTKDTVLHTQEITIKDQYNANSIARLWANKKVKQLVQQKKKNKEAIIRLGKFYNLVTPFTSLIVLDRVQDYVKYKIEPPAELMEEYNKLLQQQTVEQKKGKKEIIDQAIRDCKSRMRWWDTKYPEKETIAEKIQNHISRNRENRRNNQRNNDNFYGDATIQLNINPLATVDSSGHDQVVTGFIIADNGEPLIFVDISVKGKITRTTSDIDGRFTINANQEDVLVFNYIGYEVIEVPVEGETTKSIEFSEYNTVLSEVVVTEPNNKRRRRRGRIRPSRQEAPIEEEYIEEVQELEAPVMMAGGAPEPSNNEGTRVLAKISLNEIGRRDKRIVTDSITQPTTQINVKEWEPNEPFIATLKETPPQEQYQKYLELRKAYHNSPSFYLSVGQLFLQSEQENHAKLGKRILSNIVELELENHELLKILAHKYRQIEEHDISIYLFQQILELRDDEPQSKRDLALAYQAAGQYQKALDLFYEIVTTDWSNDIKGRFPLIKATVIYEMNNLIALHKDKLKLSRINKDLIIKTPLDIRVVLDWNTLETDMDLWITEPTGEECGFSNQLTEIGGRLTADYTQGYGPEEYLLKKAIPGEYIVKVKYYANRVQKISGPITIQVSIFTNYGSKNQTEEKLILQLAEEKGEFEAARFIWKD